MLVLCCYFYQPSCKYIYIYLFILFVILLKKSMLNVLYITLGFFFPTICILMVIDVILRLFLRSIEVETAFTQTLHDFRFFRFLLSIFTRVVSTRRLLNETLPVVFSSWNKCKPEENLAGNQGICGMLACEFFYKNHLPPVNLVCCCFLGVFMTCPKIAPFFVFWSTC